jgi:hypothetical protein
MTVVTEMNQMTHLDDTMSHRTRAGKIQSLISTIERFGKPKNIEVGTEMGRKTFNITVEGISSSTHFNTHFNFGNIYIREMGTV